MIKEPVKGMSVREFYELEKFELVPGVPGSCRGCAFYTLDQAGRGYTCPAFPPMLIKDEDFGCLPIKGSVLVWRRKHG